MKFSIVLSGVGGQGTILATRTISLAAIQKGYSVRSTESLGMAQRGGSVVSHLRFGDGIKSPLVPDSGAEVLLGFEMLEVVRWVKKLKPGGVAIINTTVVPPHEMLSGAYKYNEAEIKGYLKDLKANTVLFDMQALAVKAGSFRATNAVLLGAFSAKGGSPLEPELLREVMAGLVPPKLVDVNLTAFDLGREACLQEANF
ncbi:MAG: indolepyruvate oxidoreductase subunit beta [Bacillota bacterium]